MPATSAAQYRYMQGIAHGGIKPKGGLTPAKAAEYVSGQSPKGLPEYVSSTAKRYARKKRQAGGGREDSPARTPHHERTKSYVDKRKGMAG